MVKLSGKTQLAKAVEPAEGGTYEIVKVEEVKTAVQGFSGVRVVLKSINPNDTKEYATMLWMRETAGQTSKLGSFIAAFAKALGSEEAAYDTDNWVGHKIRIISWTPRKREIAVID
jgi:fructosamine-3-kinase